MANTAAAVASTPETLCAYCMGRTTRRFRFNPAPPEFDYPVAFCGYECAGKFRKAVGHIGNRAKIVEVQL